MAYRLSKKADQDVEDIVAYGAREFGVQQATKYHEGLTKAFEFLSVYPRAERERNEFSPPVRIHTFGSHVVIYVIDDDGVLIVRVLGGGQDWQRHL
jgi:toxin ParE1/3/4